MKDNKRHIKKGIIFGAKKIILNLINILLLTLIMYFFMGNTTVEATSLGNATIIDSNTLLEMSILDTLELNITSLPTVTVTETENYTIEVANSRPVVNETNSVENICVYFNDFEFDAQMPGRVEASFENCGTLNGKEIDMKIIYSDFYSAPESGNTKYDTKCLWWTAYGTTDQQTGVNEWFQRGFEKINMSISMYYHGEQEPIKFPNAYFTLYSEDGNSNSSNVLIHSEACSAPNATQTYVYENTDMEYLESHTLGSQTYRNIYYGTDSETTATNGEDNAVCFQFTNTDEIDVNILVLEGWWAGGYHINFNALGTTVPYSPIGEVAPEQATTGTELTYTITQDLPNATDENFKLSSLSFEDVIDSNLLNYKTFKVYDEDNNDITENAGTLTWVDNTLVYEFNNDYLNSISYTGQTYTFIITADVKTNITTGEINNTAIVTFNDTYELTSNQVTTDIISSIIVQHLDEKGNAISENEDITGKLFEDYTTTAKVIDGYEVLEIPTNATGQFTEEIITITYTYKTLIDIEIYKIWEDNNSDTRPTSIKITISSEVNNYSETIELNDINGWYYKIVDLDKYNLDTEEEIEYIINEETIEGYYMSNISNSNNVIQITNSKLGSITISKIDKKTSNVLQGAEFKIERKDGEVWTEVATITTDEKGQAKLEGLEHIELLR